MFTPPTETEYFVQDGPRRVEYWTTIRNGDTGIKPIEQTGVYSSDSRLWKPSTSMRLRSAPVTIIHYGRITGNRWSLPSSTWCLLGR